MVKYKTRAKRNVEISDDGRTYKPREGNRPTNIERLRRTRARIERDEIEQPSFSTPPHSPTTTPSPTTASSSKTTSPRGENGAPSDSSLLSSYRFHVASKIWNGQDVRQPVEVHNRRSSLAAWDLSLGCQYVIDVVRAAGLEGILNHSHKIVDRALMNAFIERWFPETNSFHLPFGEMTITGDDVENILGLRMSGRPMTGPVDQTYEQNVQLVVRSLNVTYDIANAEMKNKKKVTFKWLRERFMRSSESDSRERKAACARAALLHIIGTGLCQDKTGDKIKVQFLSLLDNLETISEVSWGSGVLTHLYRELGAASRYDSRAMTGCITLLQTWVYEHFPTISEGRCNLLQGYDQTQPRMCKWEALNDRAQVAPTTRTIRQALDDITIDRVTWESYNNHRDHYPLNEMSFYIGLIVCFEVHEPVYPDRVLRQFGRVQTVPTIPIPTVKERSGCNAGTYKCLYHPMNWHWLNWRDHVIQGDRRSTVVNEPGECSPDYMAWYLNAGHPKFLNPDRRPQRGRSPDVLPRGKFKRRLEYILNILKCRGESDRPVSPRRTITNAVTLLEHYENPEDMHMFGESSGGGGGGGDMNDAEEDDNWESNPIIQLKQRKSRKKKA